MRIAGVEPYSVVDGPGINYVIFVQGCSKVPKCPGCHNPDTHDPEGGRDISETSLLKDIFQTKGITGVTFSGGEPVDKLQSVRMMAEVIRLRGLRTTLYTGYTMRISKLGNAEFWYKDTRYHCVPHQYLSCFDTIIDGDFHPEQKTQEIPFVGSVNQRVLYKGINY